MHRYGRDVKPTTYGDGITPVYRAKVTKHDATTGIPTANKLCASDSEFNYAAAPVNSAIPDLVVPAWQVTHPEEQASSV